MNKPDDPSRSLLLKFHSQLPLGARLRFKIWSSGHWTLRLNPFKVSRGAVQATPHRGLRTDLWSPPTISGTWLHRPATRRAHRSTSSISGPRWSVRGDELQDSFTLDHVTAKQRGSRRFVLHALVEPIHRQGCAFPCRQGCAFPCYGCGLQRNAVTVRPSQSALCLVSLSANDLSQSSTASR